MKTYTAEEFAEFTKKDLVVYGRMNYGLTLKQAMDKHELIEYILQAQKKFSGNAEILVVNDKDDTEVPPGHTKIRLQPGKYNPKGRPVIVSHQFVTASIPVNRDVIIPNKYLACLEYAVRRDFLVEDEDTGEMVARDSHSYPFSVLERGPELPKEANAG